MHATGSCDLGSFGSPHMGLGPYLGPLDEDSEEDWPTGDPLGATPSKGRASGDSKGAGPRGQQGGSERRGCGGLCWELEGGQRKTGVCVCCTFVCELLTRPILLLTLVQAGKRSSTFL